MTGPMRIWLVPSAFYPSQGGVEELTLQLAQQYQLQGHDVRVVVHRHPADLPARAVVEGVEVHRVGFDLPGSRVGSLLTYPVSLARQVRALAALGERPDVVHVQCAANQVPAVAAHCVLRKTPLVMTTQGEVTMDANQIYQHSFQMRTALRVGARAAAALTACSRRAGDDAAAVAEPFRDCAVIPNGVDPSQWKVTPLPDDPVYAAWGRHVPQKGFDLLIQAFALLRQKLPVARLLLGGSGPETDHLKALAGPGVEFLGPLDRGGVQALLSQARVAVVPSRLEPFGIVAVEAMATGRGVVWSTNGGLADATGGMGWPADPIDTGALARALLAAHESPLPQEDARVHAERLDWASIAQHYLRMYRAVTSHEALR